MKICDCCQCISVETLVFRGLVPLQSLVNNNYNLENLDQRVSLYMFLIVLW